MPTALVVNSELSERFRKLGPWTEEESIGDWPALGAMQVSPRFVFNNLCNIYQEKGRDATIPKTLLNTLENMKELGYDSNQLASYLVTFDIMLRDYGPFGGTEFMHNVEHVSWKSKSQEEFQHRYEMLDSAFFTAARAVNGEWKALRAAGKR